MEWLLFVMPGAVFLAWFSQEYFEHRADRERRKFLAARPMLNPEEWQDRFWTDSNIDPDVLDDVIPWLADRLRCDASQLYPTDSFSGTLGLKLKWRPFPVDEPDIHMETFLECHLPDLAGTSRGVPPDGVSEESTLEEIVRAVQRVRAESDTREVG